MFVAKTKSISDTLTVAIAGLAGVAVVGGGASAFVANSGLSDVGKAISDSASETQDVEVLTAAVKASQLDVVQVQQFLTDISATRGRNGLDDGPEKAAEFAKAFPGDIDAATEAAKRLKADDMLAALSASRDAFPAFYEIGKKMSAAYVAKGPRGGNAMMPQFDAASDKIQDAVVASLKSLTAIQAKAALNRKATLAEADAARLAVLVLTAVSIAATIAIGAFIGLYVKRRIGEPLAEGAAAISSLAAGRTDVTMTGAEREDEIGRIAQAFTALRDHDVERRRLAEAQAANERTLAKRQTTLERLFAGFDSRFETIIGELNATASDVQGASGNVLASAENGRARAGAASQSAELASSSVTTVAAAVEELASAIMEVSSQAASSAKAADAAVNQAQVSLKTVAELQAAVDQIGDVVRMIAGVAEQTNLLALNATIEAARAGDAGRGFAVVANEVKALATQTARATGQVAAHIETVRSVGLQSAQAIQGITTAIETLHASNTSIAAAIEEQTAVVKEISSASAGIADNTSKLREVVAQTSTEAVTTATNANRSQKAVETLAGAIGQLRHDVSAFIKDVRAA